MIGMSESWTYIPFFSPTIIQDMSTVNNGAELFTVSVKETATYSSEMRPRKTTKNLEKRQNYCILH